MQIFAVQIQLTKLTNPSPHPNKPPAKIYQYAFPGGDIIDIPASAIGKPEHGYKPVKGHKHVQGLELAMAERVRSDRNQALLSPYPLDGKGHALELMDTGEAEDALQQLVGGDIIESLHSQSEQEDQPLNMRADCIAQVQAFLENIEADSGYLYLLVANTPYAGNTPETQTDMRVTLPDEPQPISITREHCCSITDFNTQDQTITVIDPYDTFQNTYTLSYSEFCSMFESIVGVKVEKPVLALKKKLAQ